MPNVPLSKYWKIANSIQEDPQPEQWHHIMISKKTLELPGVSYQINKLVRVMRSHKDLLGTSNRVIKMGVINPYAQIW